MMTLTIDKTAAAKLAKATDRARTEKPVIRRTAERGVYLVKSSDGTKDYTVTCDSAAKTISCNCPSRVACKHLAAVAAYHSFLVSQEAGAAVAPLCEDCNQPLTGAELGGRLCTHCEAGYVEDVQPEITPASKDECFLCAQPLNETGNCQNPECRSSAAYHEKLRQAERDLFGE